MVEGREVGKRVGGWKLGGKTGQKTGSLRDMEGGKKGRGREPGWEGEESQGGSR